MPPALSKLVEKGLAQPPSGLDALIQYEVYMGSAAYGCSSDTSDVDVYGFAIPQKNLVFPHLNGEIEGFGPKGPRFNEYEQHGIKDQDNEYDYKIYNIVRFFDLVMGNNPNMVDALFVPERCILFQIPIGLRVRENRHMFLSKKVVHTFRGYAHQQLHKLRTKNPSAGKRRELVEKFGFDTKFAYHIVRLCEEARMILTEGDLDLEANREIYKAVRRGDWKLIDIEDYFKENEPLLLKLSGTSTIPHKPPIEKIKKLLLDCLEQHFGSISDGVQRIDPYIQAVQDIKEILKKVE